MDKLAPIAIFIFNRPDHLRKMLLSLLECEGVHDSKIVVFADGPRAEDQRAGVDEARYVARELLGGKVEYRFSETNKGLSSSIINGVSFLLAQHGKVIVLEDDFELAPGFLTFINAALKKYKNDRLVYQVSGYSFNIREFDERNSAVFLPLIGTWGWGTWKRSWDDFDPKAAGWEKLANDRALRKQFNFGGVYDYSAMLLRQMEGKRDSWGVRWWWTVFQHKGITLFPPQTLVRNTGMDESGTHGGGRFRRFDSHLSNSSNTRFALPSHVEAVPEDIAAARRAIWQQNGGWVGYFVDHLKKIIRVFRD